MNLLSVRRSQIRLAGLMLGIAVIGLGLGAAVRVRSAWPEIKARRHTAAAHQFRAQQWRRVAGWIDNPGLIAWRSPNRPGAYDTTWGGPEFDQRWPSIYALDLGDGASPYKDQREFIRRHRGEILTLCRERVAYHERMSARWSWAAWTPWIDPGPDDPVPPIVVEVVFQSL